MNTSVESKDHRYAPLLPHLASPPIRIDDKLAIEQSLCTQHRGAVRSCMFVVVKLETVYLAIVVLAVDLFRAA